MVPSNLLVVPSVVVPSVAEEPTCTRRHSVWGQPLKRLIKLRLGEQAGIHTTQTGRRQEPGCSTGTALTCLPKDVAGVGAILQ
eukprot:1589056-Rhodomonas_salina.3